jgi:precorrin-2 dehydrogenase / sirohydrochlorin ferrochelatase
MTAVCHDPGPAPTYSHTPFGRNSFQPRDTGRRGQILGRVLFCAREKLALAAGKLETIQAWSLLCDAESMGANSMHAMDSMGMFPIFLKLAGRPCLVVGAGTIAAPKIASLLTAGGAVTVVAPEAKAAIAELAATGSLAWIRREFHDADLEGMFLVVAATDSQPANHAVAEAARAQKVLCNSVDDPPDCDFFYPSVVRRGDLQIAISTAGKSPALAQRLREEIDAMLPEDTGAWLDALGETRLKMLAALPAGEQRKRALHMLASREHCDPAACPVQQTLDGLLAAKRAQPEMTET